MIKKIETKIKKVADKVEKAVKTAEKGEVSAVAKAPKKKLSSAILYIRSTYNNTIMSLADEKGNVLAWSTSGSLNFSGARKGTPFAASKVAEILVDKAKDMGIKEIEAVINGVGSGRESALRTFSAKGIEIKAVRDVTAVPHNGPKPKKPRRI